MNDQKQETIRLLTTCHQLLKEHKAQILADPYLGCSPLHLNFSSWFAPIEVRLGQLLMLWELEPTAAGVPALFLEAQDHGFKPEGKTCWYNLHTQELVSENRTYDIAKAAMGFQDALPKQKVAVDLPRILQQLAFPEDYAFNQELRHAHQQFDKGLQKLLPEPHKHYQQLVSLHTTAEGLIRVEVEMPDMDLRSKQGGMPDSALSAYYGGEMDDMIERLGTYSGFKLQERDEYLKTLTFSQTFNPYEDNRLYAYQNLQSVHELFSGYCRGMIRLHEEIDV